tara:strand:- start:28 stop:219 length:192 start_codon:yes stop_codon:yes gene_type:complete
MQAKYRIINYTKNDIEKLSIAIEKAKKEGKETLTFKDNKHLMSYARWLLHHLKEAFSPQLMVR